MIRHLLVMAPLMPLATSAVAQAPVDAPIRSNGLLGRSAMSHAFA